MEIPNLTRRFYASQDARIGNNVEIGHGAVIEADAIVKDNVKIGSYTIIHSHAKIEPYVTIGSHCIIGHPSKYELVGVDQSYNDPQVEDLIVRDASTSIGEGSIIRSGSVIYTHTLIGKKLATGHHTIIREHIRLGEHCLIGSQAVLNGFSEIGPRTRINTSCAIPQSIRIGKGVFIAPLVTFSDNQKAIPGEGNKGAIIEDFVRIGIGAKILPQIKLGRGALIGAGAIVTRSIPAGAIAYGAPAKVKRYLDEKELNIYVDSIMKWV